jgi:hypothetical protein
VTTKEAQVFNEVNRVVIRVCSKSWSKLDDIRHEVVTDQLLSEVQVGRRHGGDGETGKQSYCPDDLDALPVIQTK